MADPIQPVPTADILKKQAEGLDQASARALAYVDAGLKIVKTNEALENAIKSSAWRGWAEQLDDAAHKMQRLDAISSNLLYKQAAESGALQRQAAAMTQLGRQRDLTAAKVRNEAAAADMASGAYARHAAAMGGLNRESARQQKQMAMIHREEELGSRYGGAGRFYARHERAINVATGAAAIGAVTVGAMANRGFGGTAEQNRADFAGKMLDRQVASVFMPLKDMETGIKMGAARWLAGLNENQQNALMATGVGVTGLLGLRGLGGLASVAHDIRGSARASASAAGVAPLGGRAAGVGNAAMMAAIPLAIGAIAHEGGLGGYAVGGGAAYGAFTGGRAAVAAGTSVTRGALGGAAKVGGLVAAGAALDTAANSGEDYYGASRAIGNNKVVSGLNSAAHSIIETGASLFGQGKDYKKFIRGNVPGYESSADKEKKRQVTLASAGFESADESYDRLQASFSAMESLRPAASARPGAAGAGPPGAGPPVPSWPTRATAPEPSAIPTLDASLDLTKSINTLIEEMRKRARGDDLDWARRALSRPDGG
jgi:hypothetical protein